jgi:hypothetical protein
MDELKALFEAQSPRADADRLDSDIAAGIRSSRIVS